MELNTKGRYAVMAMADLAKFGKASAVPLSAIAERQHLSVAYLEQIFLRLRRAGLVESARGRSGGYLLTRPAAHIAVSDILSAAEEETQMLSPRCLSGAAGCVSEERCITHDLWHALGRQITGFLARVSLQEVVDGVPESKLTMPTRPPVQERMAR